MTVEAPRTSTPYALRHAAVVDVRRVSPGVVRVTLAGPDLDDLPVAAPDGYLKLFLPREPGVAPMLPDVPADGDIGRWYRSYLAMGDDVRPPMRTYTVRRRRDHDDGVEIDVDLVLHSDGTGTGPGDRWARAAVPGDRVAFTGPYGLFAPRPEHDALLLVGDATTVPAVGAIVESLPAGARLEAVVAVPSRDEVQTWTTAGHVEVTWVHGAGPAAAAEVLDVVRQAPLPGARPYAWLGGEASLVRDLRRHLTRERGVGTQDIMFCGYWRRGRSEDQAAAEALAAAERGEDPDAE